MTKSLPSNPSLEQLKKQAKDLLKAFRAGDTSVCEILRYHYRFARASDENILKSEASLQEMQHALALDYGFKSWKAMSDHISADADAGLPADVELGEQPAAEPERILLGILEGAYKGRASDIHFEWQDGRLVVRYRVDGKLRDVETEIPVPQQSAVIDCLKRMCSLNVEKRDQPQNGRIYMEVGDRKLDFRVSMMPYVSGESAVVRIMDRAATRVPLDGQGLTKANLERLRNWENSPNGLFFITGPTGSGKTTTLYSVLREIDSRERKIITCEEPVEFVIEGINQQNVDPDNGLPLLKVIREVMRQDPDVIMIGEIRNEEALSAAIEMALTGHLVFSTMHTSNAADGVRRLMSVASDAYRLNSCLLGVMAQRLVRCVCRKCREEYEPEQWARGLFDGRDDLRCFRGRGCEACRQTGYRGRTAVQELLEMDDPLRNIVFRGGSFEEIHAQALASGMIPLRQDGLEKVLQGITTPEEVLRVC